MGGGGGGDTTTIQKADPWIGVQPFLTGSTTKKLKAGVAPKYEQTQVWNDGTSTWDTQQTQVNPDSDYETSSVPGIYPESQQLYTNQQWTPEMEAWQQQSQDLLAGQNPYYQAMMDNGAATLRGNSGGRISAIDEATGPNQLVAGQVDPTAAWGSLGSANPQDALTGMLSGEVDIAGMEPAVDSAIRRMAENYTENIMPSIGKDAIAHGQYGGTREGIAEGIASRGHGYAVGDMLANMYNSAYNTAQQQQYGTANALSGLGLANSQYNTTADLTAQQGNAQNSLALSNLNADIAAQNNAQNMQQAAQNLQGMSVGQNLTTSGLTGQQGLSNSMFGGINAQNAYNWGNLGQYAGIVQPGAGIGGTSSTTAPESSSNPLIGAAGGAMMGSSISSMLGLGAMNPWALGIGAFLGLLSS